MNQDVMDRILRCRTLPSLPAVAVRVLELTSNTNVSLDELARAIQNDQALSVKILKTVNSSFYGLRRPCSNISQALIMLGLSTVKSLALSFSLVSTLGAESGPAFDYIAYWRRGLYTAVAAKTLARAAGVLQEDEAFLGGLLQDIGMVAIYRALGEQYTAVIGNGNHRELVQRELVQLEIQHPEVGAALAQRWKLPTELIVPVRYHERPTAAPQEHAGLVRCVALGNIAHDVLTDADPAPALALFHERCQEWFDLELSVADDQIKKIADSVRQLAPLFQVNTGRFSDAEQILAKAREQAGSLDGADESSEPESFSGLLSDSGEHDALTGTLLPTVMSVRAQGAFESARNSRTPLSALYIAIDRFDALVAAGGCEAGDAALVEVAALIESQLGATGSLAARLEPAAFTVLLPRATHSRAVELASTLKGAIAERSRGWTLPKLPPLPITVSVGIAAWEPRGDESFRNATLLMQAAKLAAGVARSEGGNRVQTFKPAAAA